MVEESGQRIPTVHIMNGRVGIGTTSPSSDLHVVGQAFFSRNSDTTAPFFVEQFGEGPSGYFKGGNVGIGTTSPDSLLHLQIPKVQLLMVFML